MITKPEFLCTQVIILDEQMRQAGNNEGSKELHRILQNLRKGEIKEADLDALNARAVNDLSDNKFDNARYLIMRHAIIALINQSEVPNMARAAGQRLVKFYADHHAVSADKHLLKLPKPLLNIVRNKPTDGMYFL